MSIFLRLGVPVVTLLSVLAALAVVPASGCASGGSAWEFVGSPFVSGQGIATGGTGPSGTGITTGGGIGADRAIVDPCVEPERNRFVTISMRNETQEYIHYFFTAIAFVDVDETADDAVIPSFNGNEFPNGAVCPDDIARYTQNAQTPYTLIGEGSDVEFGDFCITGPALFYYHRNGQFRVSAQTGGSGLGSAIAPAQGTVPTYDNFFSSAGAQIPVPDLILFHNPGTGEGAALKVSLPVSSPCTPGGDALLETPPCNRDAWYYVTEDDRLAGQLSLGIGSAVRVPVEIQGTGCECLGLTQPYQVLGPSGVSAATANCNEFTRGGRIEYVFVREDDTSARPQLLWQVRNSVGLLVHDFDRRASDPFGGG